jgi:hypothetical protein
VSLFSGFHAPRPRPLARIWATAAVVCLSGGETVLSRVFLKFEPASPTHFPLGAVGLPPVPSKSREHPRHREAPTFSPPRCHAAHPMSVRPRSCAQPPHLVPRPDAGGRATAGVPSAVTTRGARRAASAGPLFGLGPSGPRRSGHRLGSVRAATPRPGTILLTVRKVEKFPRVLVFKVSPAFI